MPTSGIVIEILDRNRLTRCTKTNTLSLDIIVMSLLLNPPLVIQPGLPAPAFFCASGDGHAGYVFDAS